MTPRSWLTSLKWLPGYFNLVNDNSPELLFPREKNSPQRIPTPCFETTLHEVLKSTFKHDCGTKTSKMCSERKIISFWYLKIPKKCKILQQNNKWDWTNLTRKNKNIYVYTTIGKLPSVDFSPKFASLSLPQTESASVPSLIQLSAMLHFLYLLLLFRNHADR